MQTLKENKLKNICVFCASGKEYIKLFEEGAKKLVVACKKNNIGIIYGGAKVGLMGVIADSCIANNVAITGIITEQIASFELQHEAVKEMHISDNMHTRKKHMYDLSDGFIVLPGSIGTLDEFFEVLCWSKLHIHKKPIGLLNLSHYYDTLLQFIDEKIALNLMDSDIKDYFITEENEEILLSKMYLWKSPMDSNLKKEQSKLQSK